MKYHGFVAPKIDSSHYVLGGGGVPHEILVQNGDWSPYLPLPEKQKKSTETWNCTSFGTLNDIEALLFRLFGEQGNFSDRYLGIIAGTKEGGNDPHVVCEAIRKNGLIPEEMLPFSDDLDTPEKYYSFQGGDEGACRAEGKRWLEKYNFLHEWVFNSDQPLEEKINNMQLALKSSPLGISVYAWDEEDGVFVSSGAPNHWTTAYALDNQLIKVFDSYEPFEKLVSQNVLFCKRYHIEKKQPQEEKPSFLSKIFPCLS